MLLLTMNEYNHLTVGELENRYYNRLYREIAKHLGDKITQKLLAKYMGYTIKQLSLNSVFDVLGCFTIIGE